MLSKVGLGSFKKGTEIKPRDPPFYFQQIQLIEPVTPWTVCNTPKTCRKSNCTTQRNGHRSVQLPERSPEPAGPITNTGAGKPGEHSASITPRWTWYPSSCLSNNLMHIADIIWEALGLSRCCSHVGMSCQLTSCTEVMRPMQAPDHSEKKLKGGGGRVGMATSYLRTPVLMLRVWKDLGGLSEEDVSALQHGTVFRGSKTGLMTDDVRGG